MKTPRGAPDLSSVSTAQWEEARRYLPVIQTLAERGERTREDVIAAARSMSCGPTHLYALLRRYLEDPRLTSLLPRTPGRPRGFSTCSEQIHSLINEVIETLSLPIVN